MACVTLDSSKVGLRLQSILTASNSNQISTEYLQALLSIHFPRLLKFANSISLNTGNTEAPS